MVGNASHGSLSSLAGPVTWLFSVLAVTFPVFDVDLYWHLANGRAMRELGRIVNEEVLSFTHQGVPFVNHEWLAQWVFFGLWETGGWVGLMGLKLLLASAVSFLLYRTARLMGASPWNSSLVTCVAVMAGFFRFHVRPELFSLLGLALLQYLLLKYRQNQKGEVLWGLPALFLIWDWLHGAVIGLAYLVAFVTLMNILPLLSRMNRVSKTTQVRLKPLNLALLATMLATLINPYGLRSYEHFWVLASGTHGSDRILELQPVWRNIGEHPLLVVVLLLVSLRLVLRPGRGDRVLSLMAALFTLEAIRYLRFAEVSLIVLVPFVAHWLSSWKTRGGVSLRNDHPRMVMAGAWVILCLVFLQEKVVKGRATLSGAGTYALPSQTAFGWGTHDYLTPKGSACFFQRLNLSGDYYNNANLGGYLAFALGPERKIFQFNMPPVFGDVKGMVKDPAQFRSRGLEVGFAGDQQELGRLFPSKAWACVYNDYVSSLMVKRVPRFADLIQKYEVRYFLPEMTDSTLLQLAQTPEVRNRLLFEMAVYLECMEDPRILKVYEKIIADN